LFFLSPDRIPVIPIICSSPKLKRVKDNDDSRVEANVGKPQVAYRETVPDVVSLNDVVSIVYSLALAGHDSTTNLFTGGLHHLLANQDAWKAIVADQWYPGWLALVNGNTMPIEAAPEVFRTVQWTRKSGAGDTVEVEMRYQPASFRLGLYGLCLALATLAGVAGSGWAGSRRR